MNVALGPSPAFRSFLDEIDGTLCLPADSSAADIQARIGDHPLRFPLILDSNATLETQVAASNFAPASSRFGPYRDNIMGMNWQLPAGRIVRIGERVVKSTTGYDWFRFLLASGRRFGQPLDYVIRLRPDCGSTGIFLLNGTAEKVVHCAGLLLRNCWMHWFDAVDVLARGEHRTLRVTVHCPMSEWEIFEAYLKSFAVQQGLALEVQTDTAMPIDGCPDMVFKTSPEQVHALTGELARTVGVSCVALCYHGVVHAHLPESDDRTALVRALVQPHIAGLHALGGDWHSRHLPPTAPSADEVTWIEILEQACLLS